MTNENTSTTVDSSTHAASHGDEQTSPTPMQTATGEKRRRGFAAMDRKLVVELATRGGKAAHRAGTAHEFTSEEARVAGRKGGIATHARRREGTGSGTPPSVS